MRTNFKISRLQMFTDQSFIAVRYLIAMGCDVEFSKSGACILTGGRRWKLEQGRGQLFVTVGSHRDVSKTSFFDVIALQ